MKIFKQHQQTMIMKSKTNNLKLYLYYLKT